MVACAPGVEVDGPSPCGGRQGVGMFGCEQRWLTRRKLREISWRNRVRSDPMSRFSTRTSDAWPTLYGQSHQHPVFVRRRWWMAKLRGRV